MSNQYLGEIRMFGGNFAPQGWALCNGQTLPIQQNAALFSLIGTTYGGNGVQNFLLPNLQGRLPIGQGQGLGLTNRIIGTPDGQENVTLSVNNLPSHNHPMMASTVNATLSAVGATTLPGTIVTPPTGHFYANSTASPIGTMAATTISNTGNNQPHSNMMPSLALTFIIALQGIFPSRN